MESQSKTEKIKSNERMDSMDISKKDNEIGLENQENSINKEIDDVEKSDGNNSEEEYEESIFENYDEEEYEESIYESNNEQRDEERKDIVKEKIYSSKYNPFCISVGNTFTFAGFMKPDGIVTFIDNGTGKSKFDSVISFSRKGDNFVYYREESYSIVCDMMKYIGKKYDEINEDDLQDKPYKLIKDENGSCEYEVLYNNEIRHFTPTYVLSLLLNKIKDRSIDNMGYKIDMKDYPVILTIPADFTSIQRNEMIKAAEEAGLKVEILISEPIAASFTYLHNKPITKSDYNILVCDYGESSFKCSIFNINERKMKLISACRDDNNGGKYLTKRLEEYIIKDIKDKLGINVNKMKRNKIHEECEEGKMHLLIAQEYNIDIEIEGNEYNRDISRGLFNNICEDLFEKTIDTINKSIDYGKVKDIDYIILIGGSSRISRYQEIISKIIPRIVSIYKDNNPQEVVCEGGCRYLHSLYNGVNNYEIIDVLLRSLNIGLKENDNIKLSYGIDLGTTYSSSSCVGVDRNVNVIKSGSGSTSIPSCVYYDNNLKTTFGESAKQKSNKKNCLYDSKRFIGKRYNEIPKKDIESYPFELVENKELPYYKIDDNSQTKYLSPIDVSSEILKYIHNYSKTSITHESVNIEEIEIVIGVPAAFTKEQREATKEIASRVGFKNVDLLSEPTAAALSYIYNNKIEKNNCKMLVYDFGGGTFDVSIIELKDKTVKILGTFGDEHLGGEDITMRLEEYIKKDIKDKLGIEVNENEKYKSRIHKSCEEAKISLSSSEEYTFDIELGDEDEYEETITRNEFNEICKDIFNKTIEIVKYSLNRCNVNENEIDYIILVGGSSQIPKVKELLENNFRDSKICNSINTNDDVVNGCAIHSKCIIDKSYNRYKIIDNSSIFSEDGKRNAIEGYKMETLIERQSELPIISEKKIKIGKDEKSIRIYEDKLNSSDQMLLDEIEIGDHESEIIKMEYEANVDGLLRVRIFVDERIIEKNINYF